MARILALMYGGFSYVVFFVTFLYAVGFVSGAIVPKSMNSGAASPIGEALIVNTLLLAVFAIQHSVMARPKFKEWWTQFVPKPIERSTYVLFASLALLLLFWQWRPIPIELWNVEHPQTAIALTVLSLGGWLLVLSSTFLINHFELFGLYQVARNLKGQPMPHPEFRVPLFYRVVRHPIYLGFIIAFWATPVMTAGHLLFAAATTAYIVIGIMLEEHDLIALFGQQYQAYRKRVPMLIPGSNLLTPRSRRLQSAAIEEPRSPSPLPSSD
jgi:methanethiol S-methyltransferase